MAHLTLVLPFALPLPEFAPDLVRALDTPALAALLSRSAGAAHPAPGDTSHLLPHESWLLDALDLASDGRAAVAAAAMHALGLDPAGGTWYVANPGHIQVARSHLMMADPRQLGLPDEDSRALFEAARALCEDIGHTLAYGTADTWFLRADDWQGFSTASPDTVVGMDLTDFMPKSLEARPMRRLQNEVQMAWHAHPVNAAREARRLPVVNGFWLWGAGETGAPAARSLASWEAPVWLAALGDTRSCAAELLTPLPTDKAILVAGNLAEAALAADWGAWIAQMQLLERELFVPLLAAVKAGRVKTLELVLSNREALRVSTTGKLAQLQFWRKPTLAALSRH